MDFVQLFLLGWCALVLIFVVLLFIVGRSGKKQITSVSSHAHTDTQFAEPTHKTVTTIENAQKWEVCNIYSIWDTGEDNITWVEARLVDGTGKPTGDLLARSDKYERFPGYRKESRPEGCLNDIVLMLTVGIVNLHPNVDMDMVIRWGKAAEEGQRQLIVQQLLTQGWEVATYGRDGSVVSMKRKLSR